MPKLKPCIFHSAVKVLGMHKLHAICRKENYHPEWCPCNLM